MGLEGAYRERDFWQISALTFRRCPQVYVLVTLFTPQKTIADFVPRPRKIPGLPEILLGWISAGGQGDCGLIVVWVWTKS